ncbi:MAG: beta-glucuronidase [Clostridiales bacterium]|nr:beta-glucuronidase [Clostridiales bacterium]
MMSECIELKKEGLLPIQNGNPMLVSYNIEFAEVTGGTFWKAYTPEQVAGTEDFTIPSKGTSFNEMFADLMQSYPPINLYDEKLRNLARELGPVWVRVSGTWATKTYYDFDGTTDGKVPEGYLNVLTKEQWLGVLDFVKAVHAKLLISVSNCPGLHKAEEPFPTREAEKLFSLSKEYGVPINAAEFTNEPNMIDSSGFPEGYTPEDYHRDQDIFFRWVRANYPECLCVGPCTTDSGEIRSGKSDDEGSPGDVERVMGTLCSTDDLMSGTKEPLDVYSYHYYNGVSERLAKVIASAHWPASEALSEAYLDGAVGFAKDSAKLRDKYCPDGEMWVTESGDAAGGGDTWASTYMDVFRTLNELGGFSKITGGVVFHNTLCSSDYGLLEHGTFNPRPNYFAFLIWNQLMGTVVYDAKEEIREGAHVFVHSRRDGKKGIAYLILNNSLTESTSAVLPKEAERYTLAGEDGNLRATVMTLNGKPLALGPDNELPEIIPEYCPAGPITFAPATCTFVIL